MRDAILSVMLYSDKEILEAVNSKDKKLYKRLYDVYYVSLCRYASKLLHREFDGEEEDVVQEVLITLWEHEGNFKDVQAVTSYLYRSVYNACVNYVRDRKDSVSPEDAAELLSVEFASEENERALIEEEYYRQIYLAIDTLSEQRRQVIRKSLAGKTVKEIAAEMSISENTVKTLKKNAYEDIRSQISKVEYAFFLFLMHNL